MRCYTVGTVTSRYILASSSSPVRWSRVRASMHVIAVSMGYVTSVSSRPSRWTRSDPCRMASHRYSVPADNGSTIVLSNPTPSSRSSGRPPPDWRLRRRRPAPRPHQLRPEDGLVTRPTDRRNHPGSTAPHTPWSDGIVPQTAHSEMRLVIVHRFESHPRSAAPGHCRKHRRRRQKSQPRHHARRSKLASTDAPGKEASVFIGSRHNQLESVETTDALAGDG